MDESKLPEPLERYLAVLAAERRSATATLRAYRLELAALSAATGGEPLRANAAALRAALARAHGQGLAPRSLARRLSCWRGFYRWALRQGWVAVNPAEGLRAPRAPRLLPKALGVDKTQRVLDATPEAELEVRDRAMAELLYATGLRVAELVSLDLDPACLDLDQGWVSVTGKRGKRRTVPLGRTAIAAIRQWLSVRAGLAAPGEKALFVSREGRRLSPQGVGSRLVRWGRKHGVEGNLHPHRLRHSFASHLLQSSGDLRAVQELLGHASIASTQVYTRLDFQHLAHIYDAAHPRAKRK